MPDAVQPVTLGPDDRLVPLAQACDMLCAPTPAALRARIHRAIASEYTSPEQQGFVKRGGRWYVLVRARP